MSIFHRAMDRLADFIWTGRKVNLRFTAEYRTACFAAPLIAKLLAEDADGHAYRSAIVPWHRAERPPLDIYQGHTSFCRIDGPLQWVEDKSFAMGGLILSPGVTAHFNPFEAEQLRDHMQQAIEAAILAWVRDHDLYTRPPVPVRFDRGSADRKAKAMIATWGENELAREAASSPVNWHHCCADAIANTPCDACRKGPGHVASASAQAERSGLGWNTDQRTATQQLLTSCNRITALQGYAGTAKTTTVLATFAREAEAQGVPVVALAPTASAAMVLGEALGARSDTVARHLQSPERPSQGQPAAWIVDEASLLSARDTARLFDLAEKQNARVILVGDVKQLGSVEAGAAFAQLQGAGMETAKLGEIVRQTNTAIKDAVLASIEGDARKALAALDRGGGKIIENADRSARFAAIAEQYAKLDKASRARTLVIEPSREGRDTLTADIRAALAKSGALTGPAVTLQSLANKGLTRAEARDPMSYDKGDVVRFTRDYADKGVARGEAYRVESIDPVKAAITLKSEQGREVDWRLRQWGAGNSQTFSPQSLELKTGDRIRFTRNDREAGRINGARGEVTAIDVQARTAEVRNPRGQTQTLSLDAARDQHIAHAYVETAFAAQGRTADHVMIHADSKATNLIDQKSFYVGISRAKETVAIFTNDRAKLASAIGERAGQVQIASAQAAMQTQAAGKAIGAGMG